MKRIRSILKWLGIVAGTLFLLLLAVELSGHGGIRPRYPKNEDSEQLFQRLAQGAVADHVADPLDKADVLLHPARDAAPQDDGCLVHIDDHEGRLHVFLRRILDRDTERTQDAGIRALAAHQLAFDR